MSQWYDVKKKDISISSDKSEIHFWLYSDEYGNVYCSANVKDVEEILKSLKKEKV